MRRYISLCGVGGEGKDMDKDLPRQEYEAALRRQDNRQAFQTLEDKGTDHEKAKLMEAMLNRRPEGFMMDVRSVFQTVKERQPVRQQNEPQREEIARQNDDSMELGD